MKLCFISLAIMGLASCSTQMKPAKITENSMNVSYENKVSYFEKFDRVPSSEPIFSWEAIVEGDKPNFSVGSEGAHKIFNVTLNHLASWEDKVNYRGMCQVPGEIATSITFYDYDCKAESSGSNPLWNNFFHAPKEDKAKALADAIKGVGEVSAKALIKAGYFHSKPKSWDEFKSELKNAADAEVIKKSIYTAATTQYGADNLQGLGYTMASCKTIKKTELLFVEGIIDQPCTKTRTEIHKKIIESKYEMAEVYVKNSVLQSFERDMINFSVEGNGEMTVTGEPYNRYELSREVQGKTTILNLEGVERNRVNLPYEALLKTDLQPRGSKLEFSFSVDSKFIPNKENADQLVLQYVIKSCNKGWGMCSVMNRDEKTSETKYAVVNSSENTVLVDIPNNRRAWIEYKIQRRNSKFYNDKFTHSDETSSKKNN